MRDIIHIIQAEIGVVFLAIALYFNLYTNIDLFVPAATSGFVLLIAFIYLKDQFETNREFEAKLQELLSNA